MYMAYILKQNSLAVKKAKESRINLPHVLTTRLVTTRTIIRLNAAKEYMFIVELDSLYCNLV